MDDPIDYRPLDLPSPDPTTYGIFRAGPKGGMIFRPRNIIRYLESKWVVYHGSTPRIFNGRYYQVIPDIKLDGMITDAVDSYHLEEMLSNTQFNSIVRNATAILDFDRLPYFEDSESRDNYSIVEDQRVTGGLFAFENGILNTSNGMFLPFTRYLMVRSLYNVRYDPTIKECQAEAYIKRILPDPSTRRFFYEMVGYILFGDMNPPAIFVIYGPGETGKSALSNMIMTLMGGDMVSKVSLNQMGDKYMPAMLEGKRLNVSGETGEGKNRYNVPDGELIKQLSDGQEITVQRKYGHPYKIHNTAKLLFVTNTIPNFGDTSSGLYRRLYTIPCRVRQDTTEHLYEKMTDPDSLSWLVNKSLEAYRQFRERGCVFTPSEKMATELKSMKAQDPFYDFMFETFDDTDLHRISDQILRHTEYRHTRTFYASYKQYCYANGVNPIGSRKFYEKIRNEMDLDIGKPERITCFNGASSLERTFIRKPKDDLQGDFGDETEGNTE